MRAVHRDMTQAGVAQLVELQPSKLDVAGSNPVARSREEKNRRHDALVAQAVEHLLGKEVVSGSSPLEGSIIYLTARPFSGTDARFGRGEGASPMAGGNRVIVTLECTECKRRNYTTTKNKRTTPDRLEFSKYCRFCRKHTPHRETK